MGLTHIQGSQWRPGQGCSIIMSAYINLCICLHDCLCMHLRIFWACMWAGLCVNICMCTCARGKVVVLLTWLRESSIFSVWKCTYTHWCKRVRLCVCSVWLLSPSGCWVHTSPSCCLTSLSLIASDAELIKEQSWLSAAIRLATQTRQREGRAQRH